MKTEMRDSARANKQAKGTCLAKRQIIMVLGLFLLMATPLSAHATIKRYVLEFDDLPVWGHQRAPATLFLKKIFKEQHHRVDIGDLDLKSVVLVAKSRAGLGVARLRVGDLVTGSCKMAGRPADFRDGRRITFDRVKFRNPSCGDRGAWHIDLLGNFIVRKVILEVEDTSRRRHHKPMKPYPHDRRSWR